MCAQPADPNKVNNNCGDGSAPVEPERHESAGNVPSEQPRPRVGAGGAGRNLVVRGVRRDPPNVRKLARVVASLAATMLAEESGQQPLASEPDTPTVSPGDAHRDAA
jgi:hypothetical protein